ncbi:MAG: 50S ribosomal protein L11 methyltransferase [Clostridium sp.]|jgi:ribosomal protein L11 methyltransferase|nr:50S ribosomal protein L11 methyltransferase [Clostridium sp.]
MKWTKFRVETRAESEDIIISALYDLGFEGAQIEDKQPLTAMDKERMFVDILPMEEEDDGNAILSFYIPQKEDGTLDFLFQGEATIQEEPINVDQIIDLIRTTLTELSAYTPIGSGQITVEETLDLDWINNWKQYFHSFQIDDLWIVPSWEELPMENQKHGDSRKILRIDPGTAFGTGMHETTKMCIRELLRLVRPNTTLLDVGTGSGILSIVATLCGATHVDATDLDECVLDALPDNCEKNNIPGDRIHLHMGNLLTDVALRQNLLKSLLNYHIGSREIHGASPSVDSMKRTSEISSMDLAGKTNDLRFDDSMKRISIIPSSDTADETFDSSDFGYDFICANILAQVLVPLTPIAAGLLKPGGYYLTSGILSEKQEDVVEAIKQSGLDVVQINSLGEWVQITAIKH